MTKYLLSDKERQRKRSDALMRAGSGVKEAAIVNLYNRKREAKK